MKTIARLGGMVVMLLGLTLTASAADYVVDHTGDNSGQACTAAAGDCSFRSALQLASSDGVDSNITFTATGTITIGSALPNVASNTTITGPGTGTLTIDLDSASSITLSSNNTISISGLTITGGVTHCIYGSGNEITVTGNAITNCGGSGVLMYDTTSDDEISSNTFSGSMGGPAITLLDSTDSTVDGNTITGGSVGINLGGTSGSGNIVTDNIISSTSSYGIQNATTGNQTSLTMTGNQVTSSGGNGLHINNIGGNVSLNTITNPTGIGILVTAISAVTVNTNTISGTNTHGIQINGSTGHTVNSNDLDNIGDTGIYFISAGSGNTVDSNNINTSDDAIIFYNTNGTISGNTIIDPEDGIFLTGATSSTISENNVSGASSNGIQLYNGSGNTISTNTVSSIEGNCILIQSSSNDIEDNILSICGDSAVSAMSYLVAESGASNTFTDNVISGSEIGYVMASPDNTITGGSITGAMAALVVGQYFSADDSVSGNTFSDITLTSTSTYDIYQLDDIEADDVNYIDNITITNYLVETGTIDVNYDVRIKADLGGSGIDSTSTRYSKNSGAFTTIGTTAANGYTSYASLDAFTLTSSGQTLDSYIFDASSPSYGYQVSDSYNLSSANQTITLAFGGGSSGDDDDDDLSCGTGLIYDPDTNACVALGDDDDDEVVGDDDDDDDETEQVIECNENAYYDEDLGECVEYVIVEIGDDDDDDEVAGDDDDDNVEEIEEVVEPPVDEIREIENAKKTVTRTIINTFSFAPVVPDDEEPDEIDLLISKAIEEYQAPERPQSVCGYEQVDIVESSKDTYRAIRLRDQIEEFVLESIDRYVDQYEKLLVKVPGKDGAEDQLIEINDLDRVEVVFTDLYSDQELEELKKIREEEYQQELKKAEEKGLAVPERKVVLEVDINSDFDLDLVPDVVQAMCDYKLFVADADNDGYLLSDEIFLGFDPSQFDKAPTVPAITNLDGKKTGTMPSFRLRGVAADQVEVILFEEESEDRLVIGPTEIDEGNKAEVSMDYPLNPGVYYAISRGESKSGDAVKFEVSEEVELETPVITEILSGQQELYLKKIGQRVQELLKMNNGVKEEVNVSELIEAEQEDLQVIRGKAEPGSVVYFTIKSVVFSSVAIADADGNFEIIVPKSKLNLANEKHQILVYAADERGGVVSSVLRFVTGR